MEEAALTIAVISVMAAIVAVIVSLVALHRADKNTSLATLVSINEGMSQAWRHYLHDETAEERELAFGDLINLLEIGCAAYLNGSIHHDSKGLLGQHLCSTLDIIGGHAPARDALHALREAPSTFEHLAKF